jgi:hypothetical protein
LQDDLVPCSFPHTERLKIAAAFKKVYESFHGNGALAGLRRSRVKTSSSPSRGSRLPLTPRWLVQLAGRHVIRLPGAARLVR